MTVHYQYKHYPFSEKATARSRALAIMTTWPCKMCFALFAALIAFALLDGIGMKEDPALILSLAAGVLSLIPYGPCKRMLQKRIDRMAMKELEAMSPDEIRALIEKKMAAV